jgi:hypothetical protein
MKQDGHVKQASSGIPLLDVALDVSGDAGYLSERSKQGIGAQKDEVGDIRPGSFSVHSDAGLHVECSGPAEGMPDEPPGRSACIKASAAHSLRTNVVLSAGNVAPNSTEDRAPATAEGQPPAVGESEAAVTSAELPVGPALARELPNLPAQSLIAESANGKRGQAMPVLCEAAGPASTSAKVMEGEGGSEGQSADDSAYSSESSSSEAESGDSGEAYSEEISTDSETRRLRQQDQATKAQVFGPSSGSQSRFSVNFGHIDCAAFPPCGWPAGASPGCPTLQPWLPTTVQPPHARAVPVAAMQSPSRTGAEAAYPAVSFVASSPLALSSPQLQGLSVNCMSRPLTDLDTRSADNEAPSRTPPHPFRAVAPALNGCPISPECSSKHLQLDASVASQRQEKVQALVEYEEDKVYQEPDSSGHMNNVNVEGQLDAAPEALQNDEIDVAPQSCPESHAHHVQTMHDGKGHASSSVGAAADVANHVSGTLATGSADLALCGAATAPSTPLMEANTPASVTPSEGHDNPETIGLLHVHNALSSASMIAGFDTSAATSPPEGHDAPASTSAQEGLDIHSNVRLSGGLDSPATASMPSMLTGLYTSATASMPEGHVAPAATCTPEGHIAPVATCAPEGQVAPAATCAPEGHVAPAATCTPEGHVAPAATCTPEGHVAPVATCAPEGQVAPAATCTPEGHVAPVATCAPEGHVAPAATCTPEGHVAPVATCAPEGHVAPATTSTPEGHNEPITAGMPESQVATATTSLQEGADRCLPPILPEEHHATRQDGKFVPNRGPPTTPSNVTKASVNDDAPEAAHVQLERATRTRLAAARQRKLMYADQKQKLAKLLSSDNLKNGGPVPAAGGKKASEAHDKHAPTQLGVAEAMSTEGNSEDGKGDEKWSVVDGECVEGSHAFSTGEASGASGANGNLPLSEAPQMEQNGRDTEVELIPKQCGAALTSRGQEMCKATQEYPAQAAGGQGESRAEAQVVHRAPQGPGFAEVPVRAENTTWRYDPDSATEGDVDDDEQSGKAKARGRGSVKAHLSSTPSFEGPSRPLSKRLLKRARKAALEEAASHMDACRSAAYGKGLGVRGTLKQGRVLGRGRGERVRAALHVARAPRPLDSRPAPKVRARVLDSYGPSPKPGSRHSLYRTRTSRSRSPQRSSSSNRSRSHPCDFRRRLSGRSSPRQSSSPGRGLSRLPRRNTRAPGRSCSPRRSRSWSSVSGHESPSSRERICDARVPVRGVSSSIKSKSLSEVAAQVERERWKPLSLQHPSKLGKSSKTRRSAADAASTRSTERALSRHIADAHAGVQQATVNCKAHRGSSPTRGAPQNQGTACLEDRDQESHLLEVVGKQHHQSGRDIARTGEAQPEGEHGLQGVGGVTLKWRSSTDFFGPSEGQKAHPHGHRATQCAVATPLCTRTAVKASCPVMEGPQVSEAGPASRTMRASTASWDKSKLPSKRRTIDRTERAEAGLATEKQSIHEDAACACAAHQSEGQAHAAAGEDDGGDQAHASRGPRPAHPADVAVRPAVQSREAMSGAGISLAFEGCLREAIERLRYMLTDAHERARSMLGSQATRDESEVHVQTLGSLAGAAELLPLQASASYRSHLLIGCTGRQ